MLTDIFVNRYAAVQLWNAVEEPERRLLVQTYRILTEQICPYYNADGSVSDKGKVFWTDIHSLLSMEFGLKSLSPLAYSHQTTWNGKSHTSSGLWPIEYVCETWMLKAFDDSQSADQFIKQRLSLVEIGFRKRDEEIAIANAKLPAATVAALKAIPDSSAFRVPGNRVEAMKNMNVAMNIRFADSINELNARFLQAECDLNYHNGFIQCAADELTLQQVETPFWALVADPKWNSVDTEMKQALDLRDANAGDPAFHAAQALESTIKIVSDEKGWTHGGEKGAHNYIDNLASKNALFLEDWESEALKDFFTKIRNPFGHGAGNEKKLVLSQQQTDWAIETCMVWIKSIIRRL